MSDKITGQDVFDQSLFSNLEQLDRALAEVIKKLDTISKSGRTASGPTALGEEAKAYVNLAKTQEQYISGKLDAIAKTKEEERQLKALAREQAKVNQSQSEVNKKTREASLIKRQENRETDLQIKATNRLFGAYANLNAQLELSRKKYKDLAAEGKANTREAKSLQKEIQRLDKSLKSIDGATGQYGRNVGGYLQSLLSFTRGVVGAFGAIEAARFAIDFTREAIELERQARGVEFAFDRLGQTGVNAFNDIKDATGGTLSDLEIQRSINEFSNFNINLEESGVLFEFLAVRAAQTGKSVDSLRDSLVEGLSKESLLRIDNLGISTQVLNEELEKTPNFVTAVANIARTEVAAAGAILDESANAAARLAANIQNLQVQLGKTVGPGLNSFLELLNTRLTQISNSSVATRVRLAELGKDANFLQKGFESLAFYTRLWSEESRKADAKVAKFIETIRAGGRIAQASARQYEALYKSIAPLNEELSEQRDESELRKPFFELEKDVFTIGQLNDKIQVLKENLETVSDPKVARGIQDQIKAFEEQKNAILGIGEGTADTGRQAAREFVQALNNELETGDRLNFSDPLVQIQDAAAEAAKELDGLKNRITETEAAAFALNEEFKNIFEAQIQGVQNQIQLLSGIDTGFLNRFILGDQTEQDKLTGNVTAAGQLLSNISEQLSSQRLVGLDQELQKTQETQEQIRSDERLTAQQKEELLRKTAEEERRIRVEQAKARRTQALIDIAINTAVAVSRALIAAAANPLAGGAKVGPIIALGAAQAALVRAQPLPQFFMGKASGGYEGLATWGEKRPEVLVTPDGQMFLSPDKKTPLYVAKEDIIVPSVRKFQEEIKSGQGEVFHRLHSRMKKETESRAIDYKEMEKAVMRGMRKAGINVTSKVVIPNNRRRW